MSDDAQVGRVALWWEKWRVIVVGASVLVTLMLGLWKLSGQLATIEGGLGQVSQGVHTLTEQSRLTAAAVASIDTRVSRLEAFKERQDEAIKLFWSKDWTDLKERVERIEVRLLGVPELRQAPPLPERIR